ncbi:MAG: HAD-IA family hydrolase [Acidobacteria bacterium]|nr:HAD-IA family hydrolase [Acidobacteriota bacterium]
MKTDLIVFDLDGTLVDSLEDLTISLNHALGVHGFPLLTSETVRQLVGDGAKNLVLRGVPEAFRPNGVADGTVGSVYGTFTRHYGDHLLDHTRAYPGVDETLAALEGCCRMCVLSNKGEAMSVRILEGLGIARYFGGVYGGDSFATRKPDPGGFLEIMTRTGVRPGSTLVVGDSANDILGGRAAGAMTCGVLYGLKPEEVRAAVPDISIITFPQLLEFVTCSSPKSS